MQKIQVMILAVLLVGTAIADESSLGLSQGCWKTDEGHDGVSNTVVFCVDGKSINASVFYPNRGDNSTTCRSSGQVDLLDPTTFAIRTGHGTCENGRSLAPSEWTCTLLNEHELNCLDPGFNQIHLKLEVTETD